MVNNLYTIINQLFTKKTVFLLIVLRVDMKLNKNPKVEYFRTKPLFWCFFFFCFSLTQFETKFNLIFFREIVKNMYF